MNWPIFFNWIKNTLLFTYSTNILVDLLTTMKNCLTLKKRKMCDPILVTHLKCDLIIVNLVVKMRPDPVAHPH